MSQVSQERGVDRYFIGEHAHIWESSFSRFTISEQFVLLDWSQLCLPILIASRSLRGWNLTIVYYRQLILAQRAFWNELSGARAVIAESN